MRFLRNELELELRAVNLDLYDDDDDGYDGDDDGLCVDDDDDDDVVEQGLQVDQVEKIELVTCARENTQIEFSFSF